MFPWGMRGILAGLLLAASFHSWSTCSGAVAPSYQGGRVAGQGLVRFKPGIPARERCRLLTDHGLNCIASLPSIGVELVAASSAVDETLVRLATSPLVTWVEPDYLAEPAALPLPSDPAFHEMIGDSWVEWPAQRMGALTAWGIFPGRYFDAASRPTDTPIVAVVDTGVDEGHPDFLNVGAVGADVNEGGQLLLPLARTFLSGQSGDDVGGAHDEHGHGTHLAALIAAAANNGITAGSGIAGVGYPARLLPLKVTGANGVATHADIARAIIYAADQGASVILLGMAGETWSQTLQAAVDYAWNRGCFLVAPAGNTSDQRPMFPANCPHVFSVTSTTVYGDVAAYSNTAGAAACAPGGDGDVGVYSALPTYACTLRTDLSAPAYGWLAGTSQAAAHAAGAAALYASAVSLRPTTGDEGGLVWRALQESAARLPGAANWEARSGYGTVSLERLVAGERPPADSLGGTVGRVLVHGAPAIGVSVTATPDAHGPAVTTTTTWPAGAYRIENIPTGCYHITAGSGEEVGIWEGVDVLPGCDAPGVDFALGDARAAASLAAISIPERAICGEEVQLSATLQNTGESTWTRGGGYQLVQAPSDQPLCVEPDHVTLARAEGVKPDDTATFIVRLTAPVRWGFYETAWQMSQQGGVGRFGPVIAGRVGVTSFADVPADHWAIGEIEAVRAAAVVSGYEDHRYHPEWAVTRDQMAVYLARAMAGGDARVPTAPMEASFPDVPTDHWAFRYVESAKERCVVTGYPDGTYQPTIAVDRGQMAVFVARAMVIPSEASDLGGYQPPSAPSFDDVPVDFWAYKHVEYIKSRGIAAGYPDGLYHPESICTRDQMAVYVARAFALPV